MATNDRPTTTARGSARRAAMLGALLLCGTVLPAAAQGVFKCKVDGRITYQSAPCADDQPGKQVNIVADPSQEELQQAKQRANADKVRAASVATDPPPARRMAPGTYLRPHLPPPKYDCAQLNKERGDAFGRRNGAIRSTRADGTDRSPAVDRAHDEIVRIERQMIAGGCKPT